MVYLLDVNVLIALVDPSHIQHDAAHAWFNSTGSEAWASCPITENGLVRIIAHPKYPGTPVSPASALALLSKMRKLEGHQFWADDLSLCDRKAVDPELLVNHAQITDVYLLALAASKKGRLATFDQRLRSDSVKGGDIALCVI